MKFANPQFLYLWLLVPALLAAFVWSGRRRFNLIRLFGNPELLARIGSAVHPPRRRLKQTLFVLAIFFLVLALARPQWGASLTPIKREGVDLVIVLDTSLSMLAQDIKPSRLEKAKHELWKLLDLLRGDRVGLVAFAGTSFTLCPLTLDYQAAKMFLQSIAPGVIPEPGTALADAIKTGVSNFDSKTKKFKAMILLTDGENLEEGKEQDPVAAAEKAAEQGVVIYTVGIGSGRGEPIPLPTDQGGVEYKRDPGGQTVMSKLDEDTLRKIALATGGKYYHATAEEMELGKIYEAIAGMEKKTFEEQYHVQYEDRFQWPLLLAVLFLFAEAVIPERKLRRQ
jgi:Ca-activated chloride channel family protein